MEGYCKWPDSAGDDLTSRSPLTVRFEANGRGRAYVTVLGGIALQDVPYTLDIQRNGVPDAVPQERDDAPFITSPMTPVDPCKVL